MSRSDNMRKDVLNIFFISFVKPEKIILLIVWRYFLKRATRKLSFICHQRAIYTRILPKSTTSNSVSIESSLIATNICLTNNDYVRVCKLSAAINNKGNISFLWKITIVNLPWCDYHRDSRDMMNDDIFRLTHESRVSRSKSIVNRARLKSERNFGNWVISKRSFNDRSKMFGYSISPWKRQILQPT